MLAGLRSLRLETARRRCSYCPLDRNHGMWPVNVTDLLTHNVQIIVPPMVYSRPYLLSYLSHVGAEYDCYWSVLSITESLARRLPLECRHHCMSLVARTQAIIVCLTFIPQSPWTLVHLRQRCPHRVCAHVLRRGSCHYSCSFQRFQCICITISRTL